MGRGRETLKMFGLDLGLKQKQDLDTGEIGEF